MEYSWDRTSMCHNLEGFREITMPVGGNSIKVLRAAEGDHIDVGLAVSQGEGVGSNEIESYPMFYGAHF